MTIVHKLAICSPAAILLLPILFCGCTEKSTGKVVERETRVTVQPLEKRIFRHQIPVQGTVTPVDHAVISAKISGTLEMLNVSEGDECAEDAVLFGLDVRGIGECAPSGCDQPLDRDFFHEYQFDYHYASLGLMFSKPYLSGKVKDILCAVELLARNGAQVEIQAKGQGTVPALIAALLSDKITSLKLMDAPESWESMITEPVPCYPLSLMIPNVLAETDLPELRQAVAGKIR